MFDERKIIKKDKVVLITKQRIIIIFMHITGFFILSFNSSDLTFDLDKLLVFVGGLVFFIYAFMASNLIFKNSCPLLFNGCFFLLDVSLIMLQRLSPKLVKSQLIWIFVGFTLSLFLPLVFKYIKKIETYKNSYAIIGILILMLPSFFERVLGANNWIKIFGLQVQPSELVKVIFVFFLASAFNKTASLNKDTIVTIIISACFVFVLVLQRDLGGSLIFFMTFMVILYIATGNNLLFGLGFLGTTVFSTVVYTLFKNKPFFSHINVRIEAFLHPWNDFYGDGNQIMNSLFAIGTWGFLGSGLTRGMPNKIPVVTTDFIFAAIAEEFGSLFAFCLLSIYVIIYFRGVIVSLRTSSNFMSLVTAGLTALLAFQTFLIVGGVIKFVPLTGVTMPFVSYGGSSMIVSLIMISIIQIGFDYKQDTLEINKITYEEDNNNKEKDEVVNTQSLFDDL